MNAAQVERLIPRNGRLLSQPSLWRWCDLAEIAQGKVEFTESEFTQLAAISVAYRRGFSTQQLLEKLTHEKNATSPPAG